MFLQKIQDGRQIEVPDDWMRAGTPWAAAFCRGDYQAVNARLAALARNAE
jgi:glucan phosphorylase